MTTYEDLKVRVGRKPVTVVEIDLDTCGNVYGVSPCTAAIGTTGTQKCYNTFKTCQDPENFDKQVKTYRFTSRTSFLPVGENALPCIVSADIAPTRIEPSSISLRASVQINLQDFTIHDRGVDPYVADRASPAEGTFFGRLLARNPYLVNRPLRIKSGYIDNDRTIYSETHTYLIDSIEGPDAAGKVVIKAKDALKLADDDTAQVPVASTGKLVADISDSDTILAITPDVALADYPSSGVVCIGDEVTTYSSKSVNGLQGLLRGQRDTVADGHQAGDTVQLCAEYTGQIVADILYDMLVNFAAVPTDFINLADWQDECATWLPLSQFSATICKPTGVSKLIGEILDSSYSDLWWDEVGEKIRFKVRQVPLPDKLPLVLTDKANLLQGQTQVEPQEKDRITRVSVYSHLLHASDDVKAENMRQLDLSVNEDAEGPNAYDAIVNRDIVSRWIQTTPVADDVAEHNLAHFVVPPRQLSFRLDAKDSGLKTGDLADVYTRVTQNTEGVSDGVRVLIIERTEAVPGSQWDYVGYESGVVGEVACLLADGTVNDWDSASDQAKSTYMYLSDADGEIDGVTDRVMY